MRVIFFLLAFMYLLTPILAQADYSDGLHAYLQGHYEQAFQEFRSLAREGDPQAQYILGSMLATGKGVQQDPVRAHAVFSIAAEQGHEKAALFRDEIAAKMDSAQLSRAEKIAEKLKSRVQPSEKHETKDEPVDKSTIVSIQKHLRELGYYDGAIDGLMGPRSSDSIREYQQDQGLNQDGEASRSLLKHLKTSLAEQPESKLLNELPPGPWTRMVLYDDFTDGEYHSDPAWTVASGEFWIGGENSLRTERTLRQAGQSTGKNAEDDLLNVVGKVVSGVLGSGESSQSPTVSEIFTRTELGNVFALRMGIRRIGERAGQDFVFGPFAGQNRDTGYLLRFTQGSEQSLALIRSGRSGSSVIEVVRGDQLLQADTDVVLTWLRYEDGVMEIQVNGDLTLRTRDRMFTRFEGVTFINNGGEYAISSIAVFAP